MVTQKTLDTMKWWYNTDRKNAGYFADLVSAGKITQEDYDYILGEGA